MPAASGRGSFELPAKPSAPFVRLRTVIALGLVAAAVGWFVPRGRATWRLHNQAVVYADYAMCMVGPTGPELLRENPLEFSELVRRRVVAAAPESTPLGPCRKFAEQMKISHAALRLHSTRAVQFGEYHNVPGSSGSASLRSLELPLTPLQTLADQAWPFVRSGPGVLMKPSSYTREASHPVRVPRPGVGTGLPASRHLYRSTAAYGDTVVAALGSGANTRVLLSKNGGIDWVGGGNALSSELRDRCVADDEGRAFTVTRMNDGQRIVVSQGPSAAPQIARLSASEEKIAGLSCDKSALVVALVSSPDDTGHRPVHLRLCPFRRPCQDLEQPDTAGAKLYYPLDVARVGGDIVISRTAGGITRVASTRDEGRSWTPWTVAYDASTYSPGDAAPFRLLVAADTLLLYSGSNSGGRYPLLASDDHGASFHAPKSSAAPSSTAVAQAQSDL